MAGGVSGGALQLSTASASFVNMGAILPQRHAALHHLLLVQDNPGNHHHPVCGDQARNKLAQWLHRGPEHHVLLRRDRPRALLSFEQLRRRSDFHDRHQNDGQWHFIASTYHPTTGTRLYVDGGPPEAIVGGVSVAGNNAPFLVGGVTVAGVPTAIFDGMIDDVQVYGRALTCHELNMLFTQPGIESTVEADLNGDGVVDGADLAILLGAWGTPACDLDGNGVVDGADLGIVLGKWEVAEARSAWPRCPCSHGALIFRNGRARGYHFAMRYSNTCRATIIGIAALGSLALAAPAAATLFETGRQNDYGFSFSNDMFIGAHAHIHVTYELGAVIAGEAPYNASFTTPSTAYNLSMFTTGGIVASNIVIAPPTITADISCPSGIPGTREYDFDVPALPAGPKLHLRGDRRASRAPLDVPGRRWRHGNPVCLSIHHPRRLLGGRHAAWPARTAWHLA